MQRSLIGIMQVIEAHRASILVPHDQLHNNHERSPGVVRADRGRTRSTYSPY
jgi:hypothetical protein